MPIELKVFLAFAALLTVQSLFSLLDGFRFLEDLAASPTRPRSEFHPHAALIIPCKGVFPGFEQNLRRYLTQDYPRYEVIFALASRDDPARGVLDALFQAVRSGPSGRGTAAPKVRLVIAGVSDERSEKVNNLLAALPAVEADAEVLVFADADATPHPEWLRSLVAALADPAVTVSTGFRWYLPGRGFVSQLRAAWDTSIATLLANRRENFAWGGSMAMRAADFHRLEIAGRYWARTASDDYAVTRAVRRVKGRIRFEPRCLVASREESSFREFLGWANRQIILTRVYAPHLWRLGVAAHSLYVVTWVFGLCLIALPGVPAGGRVGVAASLAAILALGVAKGALRTVAAREMFPEEAGMLARLGARYWQLQPLVPWVMFVNFLWAGLTRRIEWAGTRYRLWPDRVEILRRTSTQ